MPTQVRMKMRAMPRPGRLCYCIGSRIASVAPTIGIRAAFGTELTRSTSIQRTKGQTALMLVRLDCCRPPPCSRIENPNHGADGRWTSNFKHVWLGISWSMGCVCYPAGSWESLDYRTHIAPRAPMLGHLKLECREVKSTAASVSPPPPEAVHPARRLAPLMPGLHRQPNRTRLRLFEEWGRSQPGTTEATYVIMRPQKTSPIAIT